MFAFTGTAPCLLDARFILLIRGTSGLEILRRVQAQIEPSLDKVAAPESQSQEHAAQGASQPPEVEQASIVLDVTTLLLDQLLGTTGSWNARWQAAAGYDGKAVDDLNMQKSLAHLKHVLRTMQHLAFVYLLHLSLDSLRWDDRPPRKDWEALKRHLNDWFAEWSGDRPPLNSTMPWNIKPSLVVLWGVCWMYYKNEARPRASRQESAGGWAPAQPVVHGNVDLPGTTMPSNHFLHTTMRHLGLTNKTRLYHSLASLEQHWDAAGAIGNTTESGPSG